MQRNIQELVKTKSWGELSHLLRENDYCGTIDLEEIKILMKDESIPTDVKHSAFFCLISKEDLSTIQQFSKNVYLYFHDVEELCQQQYHAPVKSSALFLAILHGRIDVMTWVKEQWGPTVIQYNEVQADLLVAAACGGRIDIFRLLLQPVTEGGFGCQLNETYFECADKIPLLSAIYHGNMAFWREYLIVAGDDSAEAFSEKYAQRAIEAAVLGAQLDFLKLFLTPKILGGFEYRRSYVQATDLLAGAIYKNNFSVIQSLTLPVSEGGWFDLKFTFTDFLRAFKSKRKIPLTKQLDALQKLAAPVSEGGINMSLPDENYPLRQIRPDLNADKKIEKDAFAWLAIEMFKRILARKGLVGATAWFNKHLKDYTDSKVIREILDLKSAAQRPAPSVIPVSILPAPPSRKRPRDETVVETRAVRPRLDQ